MKRLFQHLCDFIAKFKRVYLNKSIEKILTEKITFVWNSKTDQKLTQVLRRILSLVLNLMITLQVDI